MKPLAVTTSGQSAPALEQRAQATAVRLKTPYIARRPKEPLKSVFGRASASALLVFGKDGVTLWDTEGGLRWSPGMAALRLLRIDRGERDDTFLRMTELVSGDHVLDCTLGLAQDALVAARAVGPGGRVVGLEKSAPLFAVVSEGLRGYDFGPRSCAVEALCADAAAWMVEAPDKSFDVVCFDPMFARTRPASGDFEALRRFADYAPLTLAMIEQAKRLARRWVVVKGARYSADLSKLGLIPEPGSRFATVLWARVR